MDPAIKPKDGGGASSSLVLFVINSIVLAYSCMKAYTIRTIAIKEFGRIIHEFDPWFNYRAAEYLHAHGRAKFFTWFDHMSWYPLGRPVGTTIYPGIQFTAVGIFHALNYLGMPMSLNDVCCFMPAWFGVSASLFTGLIALECSGSPTAAAFTTMIMAIIPAHAMRSIGGGFDNEAIAVTAMTATFYLWVRSLRNNNSWWLSILAGLAYYYMVAAWGGYLFVLNMVALHTVVLLLLGRFTPKLYLAYSTFYTVGTLLAITVPVVGLTPLKSMEQLMPLGLFFALQFLQLCESRIKKEKMSEEDAKAFRFRMLSLAASAMVGIIILLSPTGIFGPVSMRVRSLFIPHSRTGNPLVDSVAEHQATTPGAYWNNLHFCCLFGPIGMVMLWRKGRPGDAKVFAILYALIAYYFASKMNRLIILMGPVASIMSGIAISTTVQWCVTTIVDVLFTTQAPAASEATPAEEAGKKGSKDTKKAAKLSKSKAPPSDGGFKDVLFNMVKPVIDLVPKEHYPMAKLCAVALIAATLPFMIRSFMLWCDKFSYSVSMQQPSVLSKGRMPNGEDVLISDYWDSYEWLKKNTPEDARVLAWWDYGYQITGIGNRTSLADGNTWNQAHIALIGKMLTSPPKEAHEMIRHLADYVLVWAGGGSDDMGKSGHLARIANSIFPGHCGADKTCDRFTFYDEQMTRPTPMMADSLLYRLVKNNLAPGVTIEPSLFEDALHTHYGKVRIYKVMDVDMESRAWLADPANKLCDAPGSWYCPGQYPPKIWKHLPPQFLKGHRMNATKPASE